MIRLQERGCLLRFDKRFEPEAIEAPFPLRDLHGAVAWGDELLLACSYDNFVARYANGSWSKWYPLGRPVGEPADKNHFNTFLLEGRSLYLVAHNWGESEVLEFSTDDLRPIARRKIGKCAHNAWRDGDALMVCSSGEGKVLGTDGSEFRTGEFPRGVARDEDSVLIGLTTHAVRGERDVNESAVLVADTNYASLGRILLPGEGMVLEIAPISDGQYRAAQERSQKLGYGGVEGVRIEPWEP